MTKLIRTKCGSVNIVFLILFSVLSALVLFAGYLAILNRVVTERAYFRAVAFNLAEAGIEKAMWELQAGNNYQGETGNSSLEGGDFDVEVTDLGGNSKYLVAKGYVPSKANPKVKKAVRVKITDDPTGVGVAFHYGVQVGGLGLVMSPNSRIIGNVYSNNSIIAGNNAEVTGDVYVAGPGNRVYNLRVGSDVHAHTIEDCWIGGDAYYQALLGGNRTTVVGTKHPGTPAPDPINLPISEGQIDSWEATAAAGGVYEGNYTIPINETRELGPIKINGDLLVNNFATLTMKGTIWVTGNIRFINGSTIQLDPGYGSDSGLIIADNPDDQTNRGKVVVENNVTILGSGDPESYVMILSTNTGATQADPAVIAGNNSDAVVYYTTVGFLEVNNNAHIKAVTGGGLHLSNGAVVTYDDGLAGANFSDGPGGIWKIVEWQEIKP